MLRTSSEPIWLFFNAERAERKGNMKDTMCAAVGLIGSAFAALFGGWSASLSTLIILMAADYMTGLVVAAVFKKSPKTKSGTLESKAGFKGLCRKGMMLLFVLVAYRLDLVIGTDYIRNAVIIAFMANELISLTENAGLMGVPLPSAITNAIDILTKRSGESEVHDEE